MTHDQPPRRVWGQDQSGGAGPVRAIVRRLRRNLGKDASNPPDFFACPRGGATWNKAVTLERQRERWPTGVTPVSGRLPSNSFEKPHRPSHISEMVYPPTKRGPSEGRRVNGKGN